MKTKPVGLQNWLAETKFHPPLLREDVIPRQRLLEDLDSRLAAHPLTLLSAPAGYGKTTLLAEWVAGYRLQVAGLEDDAGITHLQSSDLQPSTPFTWLSLDEEDNDPARFLSALIIALQRLNPSCGASAQTLLTDAASPGTEAWRVASVLINDVLESLPDPFALIMDDLHRISEPAIFAALDYMLEHIPPQMHLVAGTRVDPPLSLARMRARGQVTELRFSELRFTNEEATIFLNDRMSLDLSAGEVGVLQARTEGWPVGLRLLGGSLNRFPAAADRRAFIEELLQTDRYVFDFLTEEVLNRQEPAVRAFLLETSILPELTRALCQAVTTRADAGALLDDLYRRNLFLIATGGANSPLSVSKQLFPDPKSTENWPSYRYHDLFAEFLQQRLQKEMPGRIPELHVRAAQAESDPTRAVGHYLAGARWHEAAEIIEQVGAEIFARGYLDTLSRWINALPASVRESRPRLLHYLSNCAFWKGAWEEVQALLERALQGFEAAGDEAGQGEVLVNLAICAAFQVDLQRSGELFDRALAYPIPPHTRVQSLLGRALSKGVWGDWEQGERDFNAAMSLIQQTGELDLLHLVTFYFFDPGFAFLPGGLEHMEWICRQARTRVGDQVSPTRLVIEEITTALLLYQGQLAEAIRTGERALALKKRLGGHPFLGLDAAMFLIIAHAARGNYAAVDPLFNLLSLGAKTTDPPDANFIEVLFYAGRVRWLQGRLQEAGEIYAQMYALVADDPRRDFPENRICRAWMGSLLRMAEGRYREAERALRQPEVLEQKDRASTILGSTRLMLARLYWQQDRQQEALAELAPALAYHEQLGLPFALLLEGQSIVPLLRLAVEKDVHAGYAAYLLALLRADAEPRPVHVPHTGETLTPREVEVLRYVVAGSSNRAIAEDLVISEWTVKSHLTHVYRKLDVDSRTQAIARARDLGLG